jgi:hypothetical protein
MIDLTTTENLSDNFELDTDSITLINPDTDSFTYLTGDCYTINVFYGITINIGVLKKSTAGYGQFLAYSKTHAIILNIMKARLANI